MRTSWSVGVLLCCAIALPLSADPDPEACADVCTQQYMVCLAACGVTPSPTCSATCLAHYGTCIYNICTVLKIFGELAPATSPDAENAPACACALPGSPAGESGCEGPDWWRPRAA